uniref:Uncharacterized protein n=1 Tax=Schizaphis graminum TaxID=13262 RepID=A0A2S2NEU4_SCHGA
MKRFYALYAVFVPITAGLVLLWPVDDVFTADSAAPPATTASVSSAVASASSAIATASSAIATASSAIATASSAIATASSAIATDPSAAAVDAIVCDDDTADLCKTTAAATSAKSGNDDDCSTVASALRIGHGVDESPVARVHDDRGRTDRSLDANLHRRVDGYGPTDVRPRTVGVKMMEQIILTAASMFFEKLELAVYMSLYKLKVIYTTLISPVLHSF